MNTIKDRIQEQEDYKQEVTEAVKRWMQYNYYTDSFEEAWDKADQYDIDTRNMSENEKKDIKYYLTGEY